MVKANWEGLGQTVSEQPESIAVFGGSGKVK